jgi:hypothetical protein
VDTLKTAAVVVLLLAVLYGVWVVLNRPGSGGLPGFETSGPEAAIEAPQIEMPSMPEGGFPGLVEIPAPGSNASAEANSSSAPPSYSDPDVSRAAAWHGSSHGGSDGVEVSAPDAFPSGTANGGQFSPGVETPPGTGEPAAPQNFGAHNFQRDWQTAQRQIDDGRFRETLVLLSKYYQSPDLSPTEHQSLVDLLDALAGKVIYSTEPLLGEPLYAARGQNLYDIARGYNVPWELLRNINGLSDPAVVLPSRQLKVVRGPFRAEVSLTHRQLTLFLDDMYAGRFDVGFGGEPAPVGAYSVLRKDPEGNDYFSPRANVPKGRSDNPYGRHYLDLGGGVAIHGSPAAGMGENLGCISLSPRDAEDVFSILSERSIVTIRR